MNGSDHFSDAVYSTGCTATRTASVNYGIVVPEADFKVKDNI